MNKDTDYWAEIERKTKELDAETKWDNEDLGDKIKDEFNEIENELEHDYNIKEIGE